MKIADRACQIWAVLALAASCRQTLTYELLAEAVGGTPKGLSHWLRPIQSYCVLNKLPPLTVLVVNKGTGSPGPGFSAANLESIDSAREEVFCFDWLKHGNPGPDSLQEAG